MARKIFLGILIILCFSVAAFSKEDSKITFNGDLTIIYEGKEIKVKNSQSIPIPKTQEFGTQDDDPSVMADVFESEGFNKTKPAITVKTSKPFSISGERISEVFYVGDDYVWHERLNRRNYEKDEEEPTSKKHPFAIPAKLGDYYVRVELTKEQYEKLLE